MGMNLITTVIGFGLSTTFIVFVCARLVCSRVRSAESAAARAVLTAFDLELHSEPYSHEHDVDSQNAVEIAAIPTIKYTKGSLSSNDDVQCSICLGDYQDKEVLRIMPFCGHNFHLICVDEWLRKQLTCPICRLPLHDLAAEKYVASPLSSHPVETGSTPTLSSNHHFDRESSHAADNNREGRETSHDHIIYISSELPHSR